MYVMMPVNVMSKACEKCSRFAVVALREYSSGDVVDVELECKYYDECLNAVEMYNNGQEGKHDDDISDRAP